MHPVLGDMNRYGVDLLCGRRLSGLQSCSMLTSDTVIQTLCRPVVDFIDIGQSSKLSPLISQMHLYLFEGPVPRSDQDLIEIGERRQLPLQAK